jgi:hypothetical protein
MSYKIIFCFVFVLLFSSVSADIIITEIMYNPSSKMGSDSDLEWIEVYNKGEIAFNLTSFDINNKKVDDILFEPNSYLVIARELFDGSDADNDSFSDFYSDVLATDAGAFTLSNTEGNIVLSNGEINFSAHYLDDSGGDGNGHSLELINGTWIESKELYGTPGRENTAEFEDAVVDKGLKLTSFLDKEIYTGYNYNRLFKIKLLDKDICGMKEKVSIKYSLFRDEELIFEKNFSKEVGCSTYSNTGNLIIEEEGEYTLCGHSTSHESNQVCQDISVIDVSKVPCDLAINVITEKLVYDSGEKIGYYNTLNEEKFPYYIEYWVEDFLGEVFKKKSQTTNTNKKSYTPKIKEIDRVLLIKAKVYPLCADLNTSNNEAEQMVIIVNSVIENVESTSSNEEDSIIKIVKVSPEEQKFSGLVKAEIEIYKGETGKYSLTAYAERDGKKISQNLKINLKDKYTNYKLTLPIQLKLNCDGKISSGRAKVIVEGLGVKDDKEFKVMGIDEKICKVSQKFEEKECKKTECTAIQKKKTVAFSPLANFEVSDDNGNTHNYGVKGMVVYESSSSKAKKVLPYFLIIAFFLILFVLFRNK